MKFIKPKMINKNKVVFNISNKTKSIIEYYSKYTGYAEDEIVDIFMQNVLEDAEFVTWLNKQRYSKKIKSIILNDKDNIQHELNIEEDDVHGKTEDIGE